MTIDINELVATIVSIATPLGAAAIWIFTQRNKLKKEGFEIEKTEADRERDYSTHLENRIKTKDQEIESLTKKIIDARMFGDIPHLKVEDVIEEIIKADSGISWCKKRISANKYKMVCVSPLYAKNLLNGPAELYKNKEDTDFWPPEVAKVFADNDEAVYTSQEGKNVVEDLPNNKKFIGRKFPVRFEGVDYIFAIGNIS